MKKKRLSKKNKVLIFSVSTLVLIGLIIGGFFLFKPKEVIDADLPFLKVDEKYADSLLEIMSIEQKVAQLLLLNSDTLAENYDFDFGGVFISADSLEDYTNYYQTHISNKLETSFVYKQSDLLIPTFFSHYQNLPSFEALMSVRDSVLLDEYLQYANQLDFTFGINFNFYSYIDKVSDSNSYDTSLIFFYQNFTQKLVENSSTQKTLVSVPFIEIPQNDTVLINIWTSFYNQLFAKNLSSLVFDNYKSIDNFIEKFNYRGILIAKSSQIDDFELFLKSDFDGIMLDNYDENIFNQLVEVAQKKKYEKLLDKKVKKILLAKTWLFENKKNFTEISISKDKLVSKYNEVFFRKLLKNSILLLNNKDEFIPILDLNQKYQCYVFGENFTDEFEKISKKYTDITFRHLNENYNDEIKKLKIYGNPYLIFVLNNVQIDTGFVAELTKYDTTHKLIIVNFDNPENLKYLDNFQHLIHVWSNDETSQSYAAQLIFGGISTNAQLPFSVTDSLYLNRGISSSKTRLGYDIPEMVGIDSEKLKAIDSIAKDGIVNYAYPGCQVFAAKDGIIIVDNTYGHHTYSRVNRVSHDDLYDIASITKIASTTLAAMKLHEQGKLPLDTEIGRYFKDTKIEYARIKPDTTIKIDTIRKFEDPNWKKKIKGLDTVLIGDSIIVAYDTVIYKLTPKNNIFKVTPRLMLNHISGIQPALPILKLMLLDNDYFRRIKDLYAEGMDSVANTPTFQEKRDAIYTYKYYRDSAEIQVAEGMYMKNAYFDTLWRDTKELAVWDKKSYIYSDVNMIILQQAIDSINNESINVYNWKTFYKPMGLKLITFNPRKQYNRSQIVPTERDTYWRRQLIWGYVHDPSAAILGGVSGNAGLFSNAYELGVLGQMLINGGTYGGRRFLNAGTISKFTATQPDSHRGLGFDKWAKRQIIAKDASPDTYGHTGFTGACMWMDPDNDIVFVFLSNRVHPSANNWKLNTKRIRQKIHQAVYYARIQE